MTGVLHNQHDAAAYRLASELLIQVAENFSISDLVAATHVSRLWRGTLLPCPTLWARLNMVCFEEKALTFIPYLLPRSKARPLELSIHVFIIFDPSFAVIVQDFYRALAPHSHRLWRISLHCSNFSIIRPVFSLLGAGAPILESLDLVHTPQYGETSALEGNVARTSQFSLWEFTSTPQLSCIRWDGFPMPSALDGISHVTSIRISQQSLADTSVLFDLFPRARSVRVDQCTRLDVLGTIPTAHPVEHLELAVDQTWVFLFLHRPILWSELQERRFTEVPVLVLRNYRLSMLFDACRERVWHAQSLTIKYKDDVDAVLRHGACECRMINLRKYPDSWMSAEQLMHEFACLQSVEHLEITLPLVQSPPLLPQLRMRELTTLVILCARSETGGGSPKSLLDPEVLAHYDTLRAPKLQTMVLKYYPWNEDWQDPSYDGLIDTAALANFIRRNIRIHRGAGLLPELRIESPKLRLAEDMEGMAALTALVGEIVLGL